MWKTVTEYMNGLWNLLKSCDFKDYIDILLVAFIFYYLFQFMRKRRAAKLLLGIVFLIVMLLVSQVLKMKALNFILTNLFSVGLIALIIVFQPELRSFLEKVGGTTFRNFMGKLDEKEKAAFRSVIREVCIAAEYFSQTKTGALIVFERNTKLEDHAKTGTILDATVSSFLLENVFFNKAPMHDGAAIISRGRLHSAGCFLPLSTNGDIVKELGTRHRAGIGLSENSDAVVLIVSEETGNISIAIDGQLRRGFTRVTLEQCLEEELMKYTGLGDKAGDRFLNRFLRKDHKKDTKTSKNEK